MDHRSDGKSAGEERRSGEDRARERSKVREEICGAEEFVGVGVRGGRVVVGDVGG